MSNKELCISIINSMDEERLRSVADMLQSIKNIVDEAMDDAYCLQLFNEYENDTDPDKDEAVSLQDFAKELEIELK